MKFEAKLSFSNKLIVVFYEISSKISPPPLNRKKSTQIGCTGAKIKTPTHRNSAAALECARRPTAWNREEARERIGGNEEGHEKAGLLSLLYGRPDDDDVGRSRLAFAVHTYMKKANARSTE